MPYIIKEVPGAEGGPQCVYKKGADNQPEGETLGCHPTKEEAQAQIAAIWASENASVVRQLSPEALAGLCAAVPGDSFTSCMDYDFGDFDPGDKEAFCAWLHKECTGKTPTEESVEDVPTETPGPQHREPRGFYMRAYCDRAAAEAAAEGTPIRFIASTEGVKRDGKDLKATDWRMDNYKANPVVLWAHDYMGERLPIGRADATMDGARLLADVTFDQGDEFARQVESKYRRGFLSAVSVGWNDEKGGARDLLDISAVPVPADPQALMQRQAAALAELVRVFDGVASGAVERSHPVTSESNSTTEVTVADGERIGAKMSKRDLEQFGEAIRILKELYESQKAAKPDDDEGRALEAATEIRDRLNKLTKGN